MQPFVVIFPERPTAESRIVVGTSKSAVWDQHHRLFPYERIEVKPLSQDVALVLADKWVR